METNKDCGCQGVYQWEWDHTLQQNSWISTGFTIVVILRKTQSLSGHWVRDSVLMYCVAANKHNSPEGCQAFWWGSAFPCLCVLPLLPQTPGKALSRRVGGRWGELMRRVLEDWCGRTKAGNFSSAQILTQSGKEFQAVKSSALVWIWLASLVKKNQCISCLRPLSPPHGGPHGTQFFTNEFCPLLLSWQHSVYFPSMPVIKPSCFTGHFQIFSIFRWDSITYQQIQFVQLKLFWRIRVTNLLLQRIEILI